MGIVWPNFMQNPDPDNYHEKMLDYLTNKGCFSRKNHVIVINRYPNNTSTVTLMDAGLILIDKFPIGKKACEMLVTSYDNNKELKHKFNWIDTTGNPTVIFTDLDVSFPEEGQAQISKVNDLGVYMFYDLYYDTYVNLLL